MVRVLVLADTHMPRRTRTLPATVLEALREADLVLHAGDLTTLGVLDDLRCHAPVVAVAGNVDGPEVRTALPRRTIVEVGSFRIGLVHGDGKGGTTLDRAARAFEGESVDCVVFGHSHEPLCTRRDGVLFLNPGSPTDRRRQPRYSYAWLTVGETLEARLVCF